MEKGEEEEEGEEKGKKKGKTRIVIPIIFLLIGFFALRYALTEPCDIDKIKAKVEGQIEEKIKMQIMNLSNLSQKISLDVTLELPKQAERILCLTDFKLLLIFLFGIIIFVCSIVGIFSVLKK